MFEKKLSFLCCLQVIATIKRDQGKKNISVLTLWPEICWFSQVRLWPSRTKQRRVLGIQRPTKHVLTYSLCHPLTPPPTPPRPLQSLKRNSLSIYISDHTSYNTASRQTTDGSTVSTMNVCKTKTCQRSAPLHKTDETNVDVKQV